MKRFALGAATLLLAAVVLPALAQPSVDVTMEVLSSRLVSECTAPEGGTQTWEVATEVAVRNSSEDTATFESTDFSAKFNRGGGNLGVTDDVSIVSADGFESGTEIAPGETGVFNPVVHVAVPCDARSANLYAQLVLVGRDQIYGDADAFIEGGTAVPVGPAGILGFALMLGALGLLAQRLGSRPRSAVSREL